MAKRDVSKHPAHESEPDETNGETTEESPETDVPVKEPPPPPVEPPPAVHDRIGLADDPAAPVYIENPVAGGGHERRLQIGQAIYDHCGEDADGVWLYRQVS